MTHNERVDDFENLIKRYDELHEGSNIEKLVLFNNEFMNFLHSEGFFDAPASTKYHGAYEGGLYDHSSAVFKRLWWLTENNNLKWKRAESPFIVGMFHDLCKCDQYILCEGTQIDLGNNNVFTSNNGKHYEYNKDTLLKGHGIKSVMLLSQFFTITEEEMLCIRYHMGAYGNEEEQKSEWAGFDAAIKKTNGLCLWAHLADQLASKVDGV